MEVASDTAPSPRRRLFGSEEACDTYLQNLRTAERGFGLSQIVRREQGRKTYRCFGRSRANVSNADAQCFRRVTYSRARPDEDSSTFTPCVRRPWRFVSAQRRTCTVASSLRSSITVLSFIHDIRLLPSGPSGRMRTPYETPLKRTQRGAGTPFGGETSQKGSRWCARGLRQAVLPRSRSSEVPCLASGPSSFRFGSWVEINL